MTSYVSITLAPLSCYSCSWFLVVRRKITNLFLPKMCSSFRFECLHNFCLFGKLIWVQLHACRSLYDKWLTILARFLFNFDEFARLDKGCRQCVWKFVPFCQEPLGWSFLLKPLSSISSLPQLIRPLPINTNPRVSEGATVYEIAIQQHIFLIISNGHRRSSRSRKMFAMRS